MTRFLGTVAFHTTDFLESGIVDGEYGPDAYSRSQTFTGDASEVADWITGEGLRFDVVGADWAANPDGSYCADYATGRHVAMTATLGDEWPARLAAAIRRAVDR